MPDNTFMGHCRISWAVGLEFASCYSYVFQNLELAPRFLEGFGAPPVVSARFIKCGIDLFEAAQTT